MSAAQILFPNTPIVAFSRELARVLGNADLANLLQEIHYWLNAPKFYGTLAEDPLGEIPGRAHWIYNTFEQWRNEHFPWLSISTIQRRVHKLKEMGLIVFRKLNAKNWDQTGYYTINYQALESLTGLDFSSCYSRSGQTDQIDPVNLTESSIDTKNTSNSFRSTSNTAAEEKEISEEEEEATKPTDEELKAALTEIRVVSPEIQINDQVRLHILNFWANFPAAVQRVKKAVSEGWVKNPTGLLVKTLKEGLPPSESAAVAPQKTYPRPTLEQLDQLGEMGELVYTMLNEPGYPEIVAVNTGAGVLPWWVVLGIRLEDLE
jgi:ribosomal 50S subunit-associated protein YjgA (DUF615 family)